MNYYWDIQLFLCVAFCETKLKLAKKNVFWSVDTAAPQVPIQKADIYNRNKPVQNIVVVQIVISLNTNF